jgi:hypothetical protein
MVGIIIFILLTILTTVGWIQIITKAGYSPWWVLVPLSLPVLWLISTFLLYSDFNGLGTYGAYNLGPVEAGETTLAVFIFLDVIFNFIMFLVFAFSDWPVMQAARSGRAYGGGTFGSRKSASGIPAQFAAPLPIVTEAPLPNLEGQPPGWHRSGAVGAGEQSYWDGSAWTARRKWQNNDWVELPLPLPPAPPSQPVGMDSEADSPS